MLFQLAQSLDGAGKEEDKVNIEEATGDQNFDKDTEEEEVTKLKGTQN
jgi:hypothetical protein